MTDSNEATWEDEDGTPDPNSDSAVLGANDLPRLIEIRQTGQKIIVGFASDLELDHPVSLYREELVELINKHAANEVEIDLADIPFVPSGILGLIASLRDVRPELVVAVSNPSDAVREVFGITQLDKLIELR